METRSIRTNAGALELVPATTDQLHGIARYWPMELVVDLGDPDHFGLVFQHGDQEVHGIKLQPPDIPEARAKIVHHVNRAAIASALPSYLDKGHRGVMVPCAYYKEKSEGLVETGIAFFVGADAASRSKSDLRQDIMYDDKLGEGATSMIFDFSAAIFKASTACNLPLLQVIGVDIRPRLAIGALAMHFVVQGPRVFVVKDPLQNEEPVWEHVVRAGFSRLPYAPMKPAGFAGQPPSAIRYI